MSTQPSPNTTKERKQLQERRFLIATLAILFLVGGAVLWILNAQGVVQGSWSSVLLIVFTVLGVVIGLFQWLFPVSSSPTQQHALATAAGLQPQIIVHMPPTAPVPALPAASEKATYRRIMGVPPLTDPRTIQQRQQAVRNVYTRLIQPGMTALALTGIAGVGKSTLAALVYRYAEEERQAGNGPFVAEALWLTIDSSVAMADLAGNLFEVLEKPLPDLSNLSLQNQARALFSLLNTADEPRLILFDQFENLLDWQTGHALADRPGVGEWIDAINSQQCKCRIVLTTRLWPQGTREYPPTYMQEYFVKGLQVDEGIELLRKSGIEADEKELRMAVERCSGHAFALTLLASLLRNRHLSLAAFFRDATYTQLWAGNIARNLLDYIYKQQLDTVQRRLLFAFSVYREPVPFAAALWIIEGDEGTAGAQPQAAAFDALLTQHLLQASGEGLYQLHAIVASYTQSHYVEGDERANRQAGLAAHAKAAQYYLHVAATSSPPSEKRQRLSDVEPLIEAIWQYCQAERWHDAYKLMEQEKMYSNLKNWGGLAVLLELYKLLLPTEKWQAERLQEAHIYNNLGVVYRMLGKTERAREYLERAIHIYEKAGERVEGSWALSHLARVSSEMGRKEQAREYYEQALKVFEEEGDRAGEGWALNNLGWVCGALGQREQEQQYYERALKIFGELGDRIGEAATLNNMGQVLEYLEQWAKAKENLEQALPLFREAGGRRGEGWTLNNLGKVCSKLGQKEQARKYLEQALLIRREIDQRGAGRTLSNLGAVYLDLGQHERAWECYQEALKINRQVRDHEGEGKTLCTIGIFCMRQRRYTMALAALMLAKNILDEVQSPNRSDIPVWIDALRKEVGEEQFATLSAQVELQAQQIVEQAL